MTGPVHELAVERTFAAPRDAVWHAITERLAEWWCPRPWTSEVVALEWANGGRFAVTMRGPDGEEHLVDGTVLEVVLGTRFVFTNMLGADWTPLNPQPVGIVGRFELADAAGGGTLFRSSARHWSEADRARHEAMGFAQGWGMCADQLEAVAIKQAEITHA